MSLESVSVPEDLTWRENPASRPPRPLTGLLTTTRVVTRDLYLVSDWLMTARVSNGGKEKDFTESVKLVQKTTSPELTEPCLLVRHNEFNPRIHVLVPFVVVIM